ncbi:MAG: hypothetical protein GC191_12875 [Azospirillum sp.]|nr:hypothetical protein [Azospirillum sp.]
MADQPINLVLETLRGLRSVVDRIAESQIEHVERLTSIELALAGLRREAAIDAEQTALAQRARRSDCRSGRSDRTSARIGR